MNYQKELEKIIAGLEKENRVPRFRFDKDDWDEQEKLPEGAGTENPGNREKSQGAEAFAPQLLCTLQQLCAGIFEPVFPDYGVLLQP